MKKIKIISLICVILLCFSVLTVTACKDDEEIIKFEKTVWSVINTNFRI